MVDANQEVKSAKPVYRNIGLAQLVNSASQNMDFEDEMEVDYKGKDFQVSFNPKFILDILKSAGEGKVILDFNTPATPVMVRLPGNDDFTYIVMPLRTQ